MTTNMKQILSKIAWLGILPLIFACSPEAYPELDESKVPQASELNVTVSVDQSTNYATFNITNEGMVPVWIFGTELIDGKAGKKYAYTGNGLSLRFREEGTHSVEVKAYNANGVSTGSKVVTFTMNETYRDPFDPSPYVKAISGGASQNWVWNSTEAAHFGCGPVGDPLGWWKCDANGKSGFLYDDVMTFDSEGKYTFTPADGQAYANTGSEYMDEYNTGEDYLFPADTKTTSYSFEREWNEAGIEEIYLTLASGSILSYVPHKSIVENPRYYVMESAPASMRKKLQLMATVYTPNNPDGISWYYEFIPEGSVAGDADPLYGTESKTWVLDNETPGYMGCGPDLGNPTGWWSAGAHEKDAFGVTDDEITFFASGKYVYDPGADGMAYCNWESGFNPDGYYSGDGSTDYDTPAERQESTYTMGSDGNGDYIELPAGVLFTYVPRPEVLTQPTKLYIKELTEDKLVLVPSFEGIISWQLIFRPKDGGSAPAGYTYGEELWNGSETLETWFSPGDWSGGLDPGATYEGGVLHLTCPEGIGGSEWQGQVKLHSAIPIDPAKQYSFSAKISASEGSTATVKLTSNTDPDGIEFFYDNGVSIGAYEEVTVIKEPVSMAVESDDETIMIVFDFGRFPAGTEITVSEISIREITGGKEPDTPDTPDGPVTPGEADDTIDETGTNLWPDANVSLETWFSPGDWSGGLDPQVIFPTDGNGLVLVVPEGIGGAEWQGQVKIHTDIPLGGPYNVAARIASTKAGICTVKMTSNLDPSGNEYFYDNNVSLKANKFVVFEKKGVSMTDGPDDTVMLIFDFGRMAAGTVITISDIGVRDPSALNLGEELWSTAASLETWFSPGDWSGGLDPQASYEGGVLTLTCPEGIGGSEWQGQVKLVTAVPADPDKHYAFSCKVESSEDGTATVKVADANDDSNHAFFYDNNLSLQAYETAVYKNAPISPDQAYEAVMVIFDFGRFPAGTQIKVTDISLREIL